MFLGGLLTIEEDKQDWGLARFIKRNIGKGTEKNEEVVGKETKMIVNGEEEDRRVDWCGAVLVTAGLQRAICSLLHPWGSPIASQRPRPVCFQGNT